MPAGWTLAAATLASAEMPTRLVNVSGVGDISISKRRKSRHLRISVSSTGGVRVAIPYWTPYSVGIAFAKSRDEWIKLQLAKNRLPTLRTGQRIGSRHRLVFYGLDGLSGVKTRVLTNEIQVTASADFNDEEVQVAAYMACERALKTEAEQDLPPRLKTLAAGNNFNYNSVRVRKLTSRWGSCSTAGKISLSYYLVQLPDQLIDYVMLHELVHTLNLHHGQKFWSDFEAILPGARQLQKEILAYKPRVEPA